MIRNVTLLLSPSCLTLFRTQKDLSTFKCKNRSVSLLRYTDATHVPASNYLLNTQNEKLKCFCYAKTFSTSPCLLVFFLAECFPNETKYFLLPTHAKADEVKGRRCLNNCGRCFRGLCEQNRGACLSGCEDGYTGKRCVVQNCTYLNVGSALSVLR